MALTAKDRLFVKEYLIDLNASAAYRRAGFTGIKNADVNASRVMNKPGVKAAIEKAMAERSQRTEITADMVLTELGKIGFANIEDFTTLGEQGERYIDMSRASREQLAAISEYTVEDFKDGRGEDARDVRRVKFKLSDKRAALVDIGKHLGMFTEKASLEVTLPGVNDDPVAAAARLSAIFEAAKRRDEMDEN